MKALYLEPDEEITSVVDRLRAISDDEVAIVIPKRAGLLQSIINLKLLRYQAEQQKKRISIVTTDKTGRNLASAVGLTVYQKLPEGAGKPRTSEPAEPKGEPVPINFRKKPPADEPEVTTHEPVKLKTSQSAPKIKTHAVKQAAPVAPQPAAAETAAELEEAQRPEPKKGVTARFRKPATPAFFKREKQAEPPQPVTKTAEPTPEGKRPRRRLPVITLPKVRLPRLPKKLGGIGAAIVAAVLLLGVGTAAAVVLPKATVTVVPKTDPLVTEIPVTFSVKSQSVDAGGNVLPAKVVEATKTGAKQVTSSGSQAGGAKAQGEISVVNTSGTTRRMVARTRFQAPNGQIYRAQSAITAPANGSTNVTVVADQGGEAGNLPPGTRLTIPGLGGGNVVYGETSAGLSGGSSSPTKNVSAEDVNRGKTELSSQLAKEGVEEVKGRVPVGSKISPDVAATNVLTSTASPGVGTVAEAFTLTGQVRIAYFTYVDEDLQKLILEDLRAKVPAGSDLLEDNLVETFVVTQSSSDQLTGVMRISTYTAPATSRDQIKADIAGKSAEEATTLLRNSGRASQVTVDLSPFWVSAIPTKLGKIDVRFAPGPGTTPSPSPSAAATPLPSRQPEL